MLLIVLLSLLFWATCSLDNDCNSDTSVNKTFPPGMTWGCPCEYNLTCANGYFPRNQCFISADPQSTGWYARFVCDKDSAPGFNSTDNSIVIDPEVCGASENTPFLDDAFVNIKVENKRWECFVWKNSYTNFLGLADHRVNVTLDLAKTHTVNFTVLSRIWNASADSFHRWAQVVPALACRAGSCYAETFEDPRSKYALSMTCNQLSCRGCTPDQCCPAWFNSVFSAITPPLTLHLWDVGFAGPNGSALGEVITSAYTFPLQCYTGSCAAAPPDKNVVPYVSYNWVTVALVAGTVGLCLCVGCLAMRTNCKQRHKLHKLEQAMSIPTSPVARQNEVQRQLFKEKGATPRKRVKRYGGIDRDLPEEVNTERSKCVFCFKDVGYTVWVRQSMLGRKYRRQILNSVSGLASSGQVCALMGLSGSGKSTLLDILAGRDKVGVVKGVVSLLADGHEADVRGSGGLVRYVQADADQLLLASQTVFECLFFSAQLRLDESKVNIGQKVMNVLKELGLVHIRNSRIGSSGDGRGGISTGERKRLAIALELITDPAVLLLDEPTSGLDSYNASLLFQALQQQTRRRGMLVIASIHQPPSAVYQTFDQVVLLTRAGFVAYSGPARQAFDYFLATGMVQETPGFSVAEHLLELAANQDNNLVADVGQKWLASPELEALHRKVDSALSNLGSQQHITSPKSSTSSNYASSHAAAAAAQKLARARSKHSTSEGPDFSSSELSSMSQHAEPLEDPLLLDVRSSSSDSPSTLSGNGKTGYRRTNFQVSFVGQVVALSIRTFSDSWRDPNLLSFTYMFGFLVAFFLGGIFYQLEFNFGGTQDRAGFLFFVIFFFSLTSMSLMTRHIEERRRFLQEREAGYYSSLAYMCTKLVCDMFPLRVVPPLLFACITYYLVGLQADPLRFAAYAVTLVLVNLVTSCWCVLVAGLLTEAGTASLVAVLYIIFSMLFGGLLLNQDNTSMISVLRYASFFYYAFNILMVNEMQDVNFVFEDTSDEKYNNVAYNGNFILGLFNINPESLNFNFHALIILALGFLSLGSLSMTLQNIARS
eukprot:g29150.t1